MHIKDRFKLFKAAFAPSGFTLENPDTPINGFTVAQIMGGGKKTASGITVNEETALQFSAVWACVRAISSPFSYFPLKLYRKNSQGREEILIHPVLSALRAPTDYMTKTTMHDRSCTHLSLWGNTYIEPLFKNRKLGSDTIQGFVLHHPADVVVKTTGYGKTLSVIYEIQPKRNKEGQEISKGYKLLPDEIIHVPGLGDGIVGKSVISYAREDIGLEHAARGYGADYFANGGKLDGLLSFKAPMSSEQRKVAKDSHMETKRDGGDLVLGGEATYTPYTVPPDDSQFLETRTFSLSTIARWFGVPPWKIQDLSSGATFNNIEHLGIAFLQDTMAPIVAKYENELNNKLFPDGEMYLEYNMDAYLRADSMAQSEILRTEIQNAIRTPNEWRKMKNLPPISGGDDAYIQKNMSPLSLLRQSTLNGSKV